MLDFINRARSLSRRESRGTTAKGRASDANEAEGERDATSHANRGAWRRDLRRKLRPFGAILRLVPRGHGARRGNRELSRRQGAGGFAASPETSGSRLRDGKHAPHDTAHAARLMAPAATRRRRGRAQPPTGRARQGAHYA